MGSSPFIEEGISDAVLQLAHKVRDTQDQHLLHNYHTVLLYAASSVRELQDNARDTTIAKALHDFGGRAHNLAIVEQILEAITNVSNSGTPIGSAFPLPEALLCDRKHSQDRPVLSHAGLDSVFPGEIQDRLAAIFGGSSPALNTHTAGQAPRPSGRPGLTGSQSSSGARYAGGLLGLRRDPAHTPDTVPLFPQGPVPSSHSQARPEPHRPVEALVSRGEEAAPRSRSSGWQQADLGPRPGLTAARLSWEVEDLFSSPCPLSGAPLAAHHPISQLLTHYKLSRYLDLQHTVQAWISGTRPAPRGLILENNYLNLTDCGLFYYELNPKLFISRYQDDGTATPSPTDHRNQVRIVQGRTDPLSNFYQAPIFYNGIEFATAEHAYQFHKLLICGVSLDRAMDLFDPASEEFKTNRDLLGLDPEFNIKSPGACKKWVRDTLKKYRKNTNAMDSVKLGLAFDIMFAKAFQNHDFIDQLLSNDWKYFQHRTAASEDFWGGNTNYHGQILHLIRGALISLASHTVIGGQTTVLGPYEHLLSKHAYLSLVGHKRAGPVYLHEEHPSGILAPTAVQPSGRDLLKLHAGNSRPIPSLLAAGPPDTPGQGVNLPTDTPAREAFRRIQQRFSSTSNSSSSSSSNSSSDQSPESSDNSIDTRSRPKPQRPARQRNPKPKGNSSSSSSSDSGNSSSNSPRPSNSSHSVLTISSDSDHGSSNTITINSSSSSSSSSDTGHTHQSQGRTRRASSSRPGPNKGKGQGKRSRNQATHPSHPADKRQSKIPRRTATASRRLDTNPRATSQRADSDSPLARPLDGGNRAVTLFDSRAGQAENAPEPMDTSAPSTEEQPAEPGPSQPDSGSQDTDLSASQPVPTTVEPQGTPSPDSSLDPDKVTIQVPSGQKPRSLAMTTPTTSDHSSQDSQLTTEGSPPTTSSTNPPSETPQTPAVGTSDPWAEAPPASRKRPGSPLDRSPNSARAPASRGTNPAETLSNRIETFTRAWALLDESAPDALRQSFLIDAEDMLVSIHTALRDHSQDPTTRDTLMDLMTKTLALQKQVKKAIDDAKMQPPCTSTRPRERRSPAPTSNTPETDRPEDTTSPGPPPKIQRQTKALARRPIDEIPPPSGQQRIERSTVSFDAVFRHLTSDPDQPGSFFQPRTPDMSLSPPSSGQLRVPAADTPASTRSEDPASPPLPTATVRPSSRDSSREGAHDTTLDYLGSIIDDEAERIAHRSPNTSSDPPSSEGPETARREARPTPASRPTSLALPPAGRTPPTPRRRSGHVYPPTSTPDPLADSEDPLIPCTYEPVDTSSDQSLNQGDNLVPDSSMEVEVGSSPIMPPAPPPSSASEDPDSSAGIPPTPRSPRPRDTGAPSRGPGQQPTPGRLTRSRARETTPPAGAQAPAPGTNPPVTVIEKRSKFYRGPVDPDTDQIIITDGSESLLPEIEHCDGVLIWTIPGLDPKLLTEQMELLSGKIIHGHITDVALVMGHHLVGPNKQIISNFPDVSEFKASIRSVFNTMGPETRIHLVLDQDPTWTHPDSMNILWTTLRSTAAYEPRIHLVESIAWARQDIGVFELANILLDRKPRCQSCTRNAPTLGRLPVCVVCHAHPPNQGN